MVFKLKYQRAKGAERGQKSPPSNFCVNKHFKFKADAKRANKATNHFVVRRQQILSLGKNPDDGLYFAYCSLSGLFVSGSRCLPYHNKTKKGSHE